MRELVLFHHRTSQQHRKCQKSRFFFLKIENFGSKLQKNCQKWVFLVKNCIFWVKKCTKRSNKCGNRFLSIIEPQNSVNIDEKLDFFAKKSKKSRFFGKLTLRDPSKCNMARTASYFYNSDPILCSTHPL